MYSKTWLLWLLIALVALSTAYADQYLLTRESNEFITSGWVQSPTGGNGADGNILVNDCSAAPSRGLAMYDLTGFVAAGGTSAGVESATFYGRVTVDEGAYFIGIHDVNGTWAVNTSAAPKFDTQPPHDTTAISTISTGGSILETWQQFNLTPIIQRHLFDNNNNVTFMLKGTTESGGSCLNTIFAGEPNALVDGNISYVNITFTPVAGGPGAPTIVLRQPDDNASFPNFTTQSISVTYDITVEAPSVIDNVTIDFNGTLDTVIVGDGNASVTVTDGVTNISVTVNDNNSLSAEDSSIINVNSSANIPGVVPESFENLSNNSTAIITFIAVLAIFVLIVAGAFGAIKGLGANK